MMRFEIQYQKQRIGEIASSESFDLFSRFLDEQADEEAVSKFALIPITGEDPEAKTTVESV